MTRGPDCLQQHGIKSLNDDRYALERYKVSRKIAAVVADLPIEIRKKVKS